MQICAFTNLKEVTILQDFPTSFTASNSKRTKLKKELIDVDLIRGDINTSLPKKIVGHFLHVHDIQTICPTHLFSAQLCHRA